MKVVYDTSLYVDFLRAGKHSEIFYNRTHIRFLSPIVLLELTAGIKTTAQKKWLDRLFYPYSKAQRIVRLESHHFYKAGEILSRCDNQKKLSRGFSHDVLCAVSAVSIGAILFTRDRDFEIIRKHLRFDLQLV